MKWYAIVKDSKPMKFLTDNGVTDDMAQAKTWDLATDAISFLAGNKDFTVANEDWVNRNNAKNHARKRRTT